MDLISIDFSGRDNGNCQKSQNIIGEELRKSGFVLDILKISKYHISPCSNCKYECFSKGRCCIQDDYDILINKIINYESALYVIPNYRGHASSLYHIYNERMEGLDKEIKLKIKNIKKYIIIIGNLNVGADMAAHEILYDTGNDIIQNEVLSLSSREYSNKSIDGTLTSITDVKDRLIKMANAMISSEEKMV